MSVTLSSDYQTLVGKPHKEDWLVRLYDNNDNFVGIAFDDSTDDAGNFYYGCIQNKPTIRESINLAKGTSSTSNVSLTISNFSYQGNPISEELLFGSYYYINHDVKIYSRLSQNVSRPYYWNENSTLWEGDTGLWESETLSSNLITVTEQLLYTGRLVSITHDHKQLTLQIVAKMPWDDIEIPNTKTTSNVYVPVAYGDFSPNTSTVSSPDFCASKSLYPAKTLKRLNTNFFGIPTSTVSTEGRLHFYEKDMDIFTPLDDVNDASTSIEGVQGLYTNIALERSFKFRPTDVNSLDYTKFSDNGANMIDDTAVSYSALDENDFESLDTGVLTATSDSVSWKMDIPQPVHELLEFKLGVRISYTIIVNVTWGAGNQVRITTGIGDYTTGSYVYPHTVSSTFTRTVTTEDLTVTQAAATYLSVDYSHNGAYGTGSGLKGLFPDQLQMIIPITVDKLSGSVIVNSYSIEWNVYNVFVQPKLKVPISDTDEAKHLSVSEVIKQIDYLYTGADGLDRSYSSGNTTEIQEAHRDLLHRYTTLDLSSTPTGWSDLDTDRSGWNIRYWLLEPEDLKSVLDKLAFEGGFNWYLKADGQTIKYIHLPDTPSSDHTLTEDDINNLKISHVPFNSLITKSEYSYEKHPAENRYISTATYTDSTLRTNYNIGTEDNVKQIKLDALVANVTGGTGANASHGNYYDTIYSTVNILASCDVINDSIGYAIELGDFIQWSSMPTEPFGANFSSNYYIVTSIKRSPGKTSIETMAVPDTSGGGGGG